MNGYSSFGGMQGNPYDRLAPRDPYARFLQQPTMPRQAPPTAQRSAAFPAPPPAPRPQQPGHAFPAAPPARMAAAAPPPPTPQMAPGAGNFQAAGAPMRARPPQMSMAQQPAPPPMARPPMQAPPQRQMQPGLMGAGAGAMALSDDKAKYEKRVIRDLFHEY